jgi:allantoinase
MPALKDVCKGKFHVDYTFHIAPIRREHRSELEMLADDHGVTSFKIFMFYGGHGLHGKITDHAKLHNQSSDFLMIKDEEGHAYDFAHFEFIMRELKKLSDKRPDIGPELSLSLHCEFADILKAYTGLVESEGKLQGLAAYSASRPPHSEGMAIFLASYLADETAFPRINLLHLTSKKAFVAAMQMAVIFPHIDFRREVTIGHLLIDCDCMSFPKGSQCFAKVNPPIRPREDVEYLWKMMIEGKVDWVVSDHACCSKEQKVAEADPDNITKAKSGFGGAEWLLSGLFSEGTKRGLTPNRVAALVSKNPADRFGLKNKGDIAVGKDADFVIFDPKAQFIVRGADSPSQQGFSVFEGATMTGKVMKTFLRGSLIYENGKVIGEPEGQFLPRGVCDKK